MTSLTRSAAYTASSPARRPGFYERLVLRAMHRLPAGRLDLELPDGTRLALGAPRDPHWHRRTAAPAALALP